MLQPIKEAESIIVSRELSSLAGVDIPSLQRQFTNFN